MARLETHGTFINASKTSRSMGSVVALSPLFCLVTTSSVAFVNPGWSTSAILQSSHGVQVRGLIVVCWKPEKLII